MQKKLGEMLVDAQVLTLEQLQEALEAQRETGKRLGEVAARSPRSARRCTRWRTGSGTCSPSSRR